MEFRRRRRRKVEVNIVPMVDVLTVLIFFFLLTMQFKEIYAVDVTPPEMKTATELKSEDRPSRVLVDKNGDYFIDGNKTDLESIEKRFSQIAEKSENSAVIILADKDAPLHFVTSVLDSAKSAKIKKASLQTKGK